MAGDRETGVAAMRMEEGLDTGPVCLLERVAIGADETAEELTARLASLGADVMVRALRALEAGGLDCAPQVADGITYAGKIEKAEARIDWTRDAAEIHNRVRGLSPFPGAWFEMAAGTGAERVKVLRTKLAQGSGDAGTILGLDPLIVACGSGALSLVALQRAGKRPVAAAEFVRGARLAIGARLA
jgi:methionyl-tRNA formyltransferase